MSLAEINALFDVLPLREIAQLLAIVLLIAWILLLWHKCVSGARRLMYRGILTFSIVCFLTYHILALISLGATPIFLRHEITNFLAIIQLCGYISLIAFSLLYAHKKVCIY